MAWDNEKKKVKTAVAVAYEPGDKAPKILASGKGEVAKALPRGVREKNGSYEARAVVNGIRINLYGTDLNELMEEFEKAKENDVPFYKDNKLAETLSKLEIGDAIPPELYEVVAEILVFVDDMDKMKAKLQQADMLS